MRDNFGKKPQNCLKLHYIHFGLYHDANKQKIIVRKLFALLT